MKILKWWCKRRHWMFWKWRSYSWGTTYVTCPKCGRSWTINKNTPIKE